MLSHEILRFVFVAILAFADNPPPTTNSNSSKSNPTAEEILRAVANAYATCPAYSDYGHLDKRIVGRAMPGTNWYPLSAEPGIMFATNFKRHGEFRFYFQTRDCNPYIIWIRDKEFLTGYWPKDIKPVGSLGHAFAPIAGASSGVDRVAVLLVPENANSWLDRIENKQRIEDSVQDTSNCFRIRGQYVDQITLWIDKSSFLIRRIDSLEEHATRSVDTSVIFYSKLSLPDPPEDAGPRHPQSESPSSEISRLRKGLGTATVQTPPRDVISLEKWKPHGEHQGIIAPACQADQGLAGETKPVRETAEKFLAEKRLLPPDYRFCIDSIDRDTWEVLCIPSELYMNSPVTLIISDGKVRHYFFIEAANPRIDFPHSESPLPPVPVFKDGPKE